MAMFSGYIPAYMGRRGWTGQVGSRDWPWFSSLTWWQKGLFALAAFVLLMTLLLLPRYFSGSLLASVFAVIFALSFLSMKAWQRIVLVGLLSAALTALLLLTQHIAPYAVVAVAVVALVLSFVGGWSHPKR